MGEGGPLDGRRGQNASLIVLAADPPRPVGELPSLRSLIDGAVLDLMRPPSGWPGRKRASITVDEESVLI